VLGVGRMHHRCVNVQRHLQRRIAQPRLRTVYAVIRRSAVSARTLPKTAKLFVRPQQ
jgi:hypothetical protein